MGLLERLRGGLGRTREVLNTPIEDLVRGRRPLDAQALEAVEEALLAADMGLPAVEEAMRVLRERSGEIAAPGLAGMRQVLREEVRRTLERPPGRPPFSAKPWVVFVVGVNGAGKTTTIGKLAAGLSSEGRSVLLCAADTFRAAAAEQLEAWASRAGASFHRGASGADPSSVLTDALRSARARGTDAVLVDTAGRLHTKANLMAELAKMARVAGREVPGAPHETLLVLDAIVGGNGIAQGREFAKASGVTGLVLAKLDGTAKGGVAVAVVRELGVPIRYVGVGEKIEDLLPFDAEAFAASLVGE
ncbi:MAG TPA: signal recognition particle-docking protein FtsY [Vicinamibacteria bacterium]